MSVQPGPTDKRYAANGVSTIYTVPFLVIEAGDLNVYLNDVLMTSGYIHTGIGEATSTLTFTTPPLGDLYLLLDVSFQRLTDYQENGDLLADTLNRDFDRIWQAIKQLLRYSGRTPQLGVNDVDGNGWYQAKGNGLRGLRDPVEAQDAVTKSWISTLIDSVSGAINTTLGIAYDAGNLFDYLKYGNNRTVDSIAALRALSSSRNQRATVLGYYGKGDGGGGVYYADLTDTTTADNGGTVIEADDGTRWKLATTDVVDIRQYGARSGSAISSSSQIQKAFDDGGTKSAADGVYLLGSTVSYDHSAADFPHTGDPSKRLTFLGNSMGNTIVEVATGLAVGFLLKGGILTRSQGGWGYSRFGRMTIVGKDRSMVPANRTGVGVHHRTIGYDHISDLSVQHMDTGILIQGCLSNEYTNIYLRENNFGMVVSRFAGETLPNAMNFSKVVATGCSTTAIYFDLMGAGNSWRDGSIEGNGTPGALNSFGFKANLLGDNGLACLEMDNVYFESNAGVADLDLDNVGSKPVVVVLKKCNFHRLSNSSFTTCNIRLRSSGGGKLTLILQGCGFLSGGDYAPSQSRPFIDEGADCHVIGWDTCTTSEVVSVGYAFNSASSARISGSATGSGTILNAPFNTFITRLNPGEYKISTPGGYGSTKEGYVPSVVPIGLVADVRLAYLTRNSASEFQFAFRGPSSTPYQDSDFMFTVDKSK
ncbi:hypothetical protein GIW54_07115 [Pseudomonas proteolytica]|uniref:Uncharacterized protein n=1 Tax=Pseudomonas proteolytica TaxID=219574 RepID=A0AAW4ZU07_9PSED|nr:hypothetical protein [Pseudomonas proteolytica]MCF5056019.1 hypothetical protein [Pseudomonas proteolytica]MCF5100533.1 hypothetical protein [Pseudomonas proteolytica]